MKRQNLPPTPLVLRAVYVLDGVLALAYAGLAVAVWRAGLGLEFIFWMCVVQAACFMILPALLALRLRAAWKGQQGITAGQLAVPWALVGIEVPHLLPVALGMLLVGFLALVLNSHADVVATFDGSRLIQEAEEIAREFE